MNTELMTQENKTALALAADVDARAMGAVKVEESDVLIPRLILMQKLSEFVDKEIAKTGDYVESVDKKVVCPKGKSLEFLVFATSKSLRVEEDGEWKETLPWVSDYADRTKYPYEEVQNGVVIKRQKVMNFTLLLTSEIAEGGAFPYMLSVKSSASKAGKKLLSEFMKLQMFNKPPYAKVFSLSVEESENAKGTWYTPVISTARDSTPAEIEAARNWFMTVSQNSAVVVHNVDEGGDVD